MLPVNPGINMLFHHHLVVVQPAHGPAAPPAGEAGAVARAQRPCAYVPMRHRAIPSYLTRMTSACTFIAGTSSSTTLTLGALLDPAAEIPNFIGPIGFGITALAATLPFLMTRVMDYRLKCAEEYRAALIELPEVQLRRIAICARKAEPLNPDGMTACVAKMRQVLVQNPALNVNTFTEHLSSLSQLVPTQQQRRPHESITEPAKQLKAIADEFVALRRAERITMDAMGDRLVEIAGNLGGQAGLTRVQAAQFRQVLTHAIVRSMDGDTAAVINARSNTFNQRLDLVPAFAPPVVIQEADFLNPGQEL